MVCGGWYTGGRGGNKGKEKGVRREERHSKVDSQPLWASWSLTRDVSTTQKMMWPRHAHAGHEPRMHIPCELTTLSGEREKVGGEHRVLDCPSTVV